jgi:hypothetical protein
MFGMKFQLCHALLVCRLPKKKRPYMPPIDPAAFKGKSGRKMSEAGPNPHFCLQLL